MDQMNRQLSLFGEEAKKMVKKVKASGGSQNPIVFRDYESYVAKFQNSNAPKTTDDTYTPKDVYEAVLQYVGENIDLSDKVILRPFYPNGDYENAEYPENGVVIDNPPFSIFTKICKFYTEQDIPFFLFGPGLTILSVSKFCTSVFINQQIKFHNGAVVRCNFASNLFGDLSAMTSVRLNELIKNCPSQSSQDSRLPRYVYPDEVISCSDMMIIAGGSVDFKVERRNTKNIKEIGHVKLFGGHLLTNSEIGARKEELLSRVRKSNKIGEIVQMTEMERLISESLK